MLMEDSYRGMTAEEIYPFLEDKDDESKTLDQHVYDRDEADEGKRDAGGGENKAPKDNPRDGGQTANDRPEAVPDTERGGAPQPPPLSSSEREALAVQWQQRLAGAAQQAAQAGKLGGELARMVDFLLQPQLPWRMLLARYMTTVARDDYSYSRPNSRRGDPAILPSLRSAQINLVVALDVSGSVSGTEMTEFLSEVDALKGQMRARITLLACDAKLAPDAPWCFEPWEAFALPRSFKGGGGTNFNPVFEWVSAQDMQPDLLVYFTDAQGRFPDLAPAYPVIWLVKGKTPVPWGQRVQLN
jgi:predicted metal-dependent peptidase